MRTSRILGLVAALVAVAGAAGAWMHTQARPAELAWLSDYDEALSEAGRTDKPVLLYLHTDWCTFCRKMESTTLVDPTVIDEIGSDYIWLRLNAEEDEEGVALRDRFGVANSPAMILLDAAGDEIDRLEGYIYPERFALDLRTQLASPMSLGSLRSRVEEQPDSVEAHYRYGTKLLDRNEFGEAVSHLSRVVELDPENESGFSDSGLFYLARSLSRVGETKAALNALEALEKRFPGSPHLPDAVILKAELFLVEGQPGQASRALQAFLVEYPNHDYSQRIREFLAQRAPAGVPAASH